MHAIPLLLVAISFASALTIRNGSRRHTPTKFDTFTPQQCLAEGRSCSQSTADTCCVAKMGLVILAQQWVPKYGPNNQFTMHGLWPNNCDGTFTNMSCDNNREHDDVKEFITSSLESKLNTFWPSSKGKNSQFWTAEWNKHGTCVSTLEPRCFADGEYKKGAEIPTYFEKVLELREKFNLYAALTAANIMPSATTRYETERVIKAIRDMYGATVKLSCKGGAIYEVQMAFHVIGKSSYTPVDYFMDVQKPCPPQIYFPLK